MRLVGKNTLHKAILADDSVGNWLRSWLSELSDANWKHPTDVCEQVPNATEFDQGHFIFPIKDSSKKVSLQIAFPQGIAVITGLK